MVNAPLPLIGYLSGLIATVAAAWDFPATLKRGLPRVGVALVAWAVWLAVRSVGAPLQMYGALVVLSGYLLAHKIQPADRAPFMRWVANWYSLLIVADFIASRGRPSMLANPNLHAAFFVQAAFYVHPAWAALVLALTGSRSAVLALVVGYWGMGKLPARWGVLVLVVAVPLLTVMRFATTTDRLNSWSEAGRVFWANPWGIGVGGWAAMHDGKEHADSLPLNTAAESGVVGLVMLGALVAAIVQAGRRGPALGAVVAMGVMCLLDNVWMFPAAGLAFGANLFWSAERN